ncbi:MAG: SPASM domain-containing protein [Clostridia bacterium]|nr:SPASM domain-containing protein [Clostridia bacterium]
MPPIHIMVKPVSGSCNLRCRYCFYADETSRRAEPCRGVMGEETVRALIRKAFFYADGAVTFSFQGGEPTLAGAGFYRSFLAEVGRSNTRGLPVAFALQTNATALTDELCELFSQNGFLVGVSLDGPKEIHDALRADAGGAGSYDAVRRGIALLRRHRADFNLLCVLTEGSAARIGEVWEELAPFGHLQFIPCLDALDGKETAFSLRAETYGRALVEIFDRYRAAFFSSAPVRERRMDNYLSILLGYPPEHCGMSGRCGVYFLCEADGSVYPCDFYALDEWKLGNVCESSFARMAASPAAKRFAEEGSRRPERCRDCRYLFLCGGGCRRDREPGLTENRFCESYRFFFDRRLGELRALAEAVKKQNRL